MDLLERMSMMGAVLSANMTSMTDEEKDRYRVFSKTSLTRLKAQTQREKRSR